MEELDANQSVEETPEVQEDTQAEETPQETVESEPVTTQEEQNYFTVKYNKEEKQVPYEEAPDYIQKGMNYDKVKERAETLEQQTQYLERLAKMSGYNDTDTFIEAVEQAEREQQAKAEAEKMGIDPDTYKQYYEPMNNEVSQLKTELETLRQQETQRQVESEINQLRGKYEDFDSYQDQVLDLAMKGYELEDAYKLASYEDRLNNISKQKEQEVLAQVSGRNEKQVVSSNDKGSNAQFNPANMSFDDIEAISKRVRSGERIKF